MTTLQQGHPLGRCIKIQQFLFFLNNQLDALIIQIYCVIKLYMFHRDSVWKGSSNLHDTYQNRMYSGKLLMMGKEDARNM